MTEFFYNFFKCSFTCIHKKREMSQATINKETIFTSKFHYSIIHLEIKIALFSKLFQILRKTLRPEKNVILCIQNIVLHEIYFEDIIIFLFMMQISIYLVIVVSDWRIHFERNGFYKILSKWTLFYIKNATLFTKMATLDSKIILN